MLDIKNVIGTIIAGAIGWWLVHYVSAPVLSLRRLRQEIHEELFFTKNVGWIHANGKIAVSEKDQYDRAVLELRRLAARMSALGATWPRYLNYYLWILHLDLDSAIKGLTGLSNGLAEPAFHAQFVAQIEKALSLPQSYPEETLKSLRAQRMRRSEKSYEENEPQ